MICMWITSLDGIKLDRFLTGCLWDSIMASCNQLQMPRLLVKPLVVFPPGLPWRDSALALSKFCGWGLEMMASNTNRHRFKDGTRNDAASNKWTRNVESGSKQTQYMMYMMYMCSWKPKAGSWQLTRTRFHQTIQKIGGSDDAKTTIQSTQRMPATYSNKKNLSICSNRSFWQKSNPSAFWRLLNVTEFLELLLRCDGWLHVVVYKPHKLNPQLGIWPWYLFLHFLYTLPGVQLGLLLDILPWRNSSQSWDIRIC